jgi:penicillin-binding protein 2
MPDGSGRDWYLGDTYITTIGQGDVLATPLQINNYITYFANGGSLMRPRVLKAIDGIEEYKPEVIAQDLTDSHTLEVVREGMKMAVQPGGTAYPLFDFSTRHPGIELAGKTGTSEYKDAQGKDGTHAWLCVFGPYDNATISLTVFLEGGGGGSDNAAPLAKELLDLWFKDIHN